VAVGAQESQVVEPVVAIVAVDVIELEWDWHALPFGETAAGAGALQETFLEETSLELVGLDRRGVVEIRGQGFSRRKRLAAAPRSTSEL
jgi:hypothetical protein